MEQILNSKGEPIVLTQQEQKLAQHNQQICNALGYEINITTLTAIQKRVVEQKFFTIDVPEYLPLAVGNGAFSNALLTYRDFSISGGFETGLINTGSANSRLAEADSGVDAISVPIVNWAKQIGWSVFELQQASKSGNWDLVSSKEKARKRDWDLGIQRVAFLGLDSNTNVKGLLTQSNVTANTTLITKAINSMTASEFNTFLAGLIGAYRTNSKYTAMPNRFVIPELDYDGLINFPDSTYPVKTKLEILESAFKVITGDPSAKILKCAYGDQANNATVSGLNKNRYALYNYEEDSLRMDIPVDYTNTLANTVNGFNYQNVGYGQITGAKAYREREMLYFDY